MSKAAAFVLDAGHAGTGGFLFAQAFTVMSISWDLLEISSAKDPNAIALGSFYYRKAIKPSTMMIVIQLLFLLGGFATHARILYGTLTRGGSTKRRIIDLLAVGLFVGMVSFTLHTVVPLERLIGAQWARSVGLTDLPDAINIELSSEDFLARHAALYSAHLTQIMIAFGMLVCQGIAFSTQKITIVPDDGISSVAAAVVANGDKPKTQ